MNGTNLIWKLGTRNHYQVFKKALLKFIRPSASPIYNIRDPTGLTLYYMGSYANLFYMGGGGGEYAPPPYLTSVILMLGTKFGTNHPHSKSFQKI